MKLIDEGPSAKLALSENGSREKYRKLAANVIQTRPTATMT